MTRVKRNGTPIKTVKIEFEGDLPNYVCFAMQRFSVSLFIDKVWQCYKCQRLGHSAMDCNSKPRCMICAKEHETRTCPHKSVGGLYENRKCANCGENHTANYGGCRVYREAKHVERVRAEQKLSYRDAVQMVQQEARVANTNRQSTTVPSVSTRNGIQSNQNSQTRYNTNNLTSTARPQTTNAKVETREVEVQTEPIPNIQEEIPQATLLKVVQLVIGLINLPNKTNSDINELVKTTTGIDLNDSLPSNSKLTRSLNTNVETVEMDTSPNIKNVGVKSQPVKAGTAVVKEPIPDNAFKLVGGKSGAKKKVSNTKTKHK